MCSVSLFAQERGPHIFAVNESPTLNPLAGTVKLPTPVPISEVSTVVFVISVPNAVCAYNPPEGPGGPGGPGIGGPTTSDIVYLN